MHLEEAERDEVNDAATLRSEVLAWRAFTG
jgi:hypothetical protein